MQPLNSVLKDSVQTAAGEPRLQGAGAVQLWPRVVGEAVARATRAAYVHDGVLLVEVKSSVWGYELGFYKETFLTLLNEGLGSPLIQEIRFRVRDLAVPAEPAPRAEHCAEPPVPLPPEAAEEVDSLTAPVGDPQLRERLRGVLLREVAKREARVQRGEKPCARCGTLHPDDNRLCPLCRMEARKR